MKHANPATTRSRRIHQGTALRWLLHIGIFASSFLTVAGLSLGLVG